ncbi:MAG: hypothetical protein ABI557_19845, partial [Aureliella sp.]
MLILAATYGFIAGESKPADKFNASGKRFLVFEVSCAGEDHRNSVSIAGRDDFVVAQRPTGLHNGD